MKNKASMVVLKVALPADEVNASGVVWVIRAGYAESPFGTCLVAECPHGICHLSFVDEWDRLVKTWPNAEFINDDQWAGELCGQVFVERKASSLQLIVKGTEFQVKVWRALLKIPFGKTVSYSDLAKQVGNPKASRAVGTAVGNNPIAFLIPCHRVVRRDGSIGGYRWGVERKRAILAWERS